MIFLSGGSPPEGHHGMIVRPEGEIICNLEDGFCGVFLIVCGKDGLGGLAGRRRAVFSGADRAEIGVG